MKKIPSLLLWLPAYVCFGAGISCNRDEVPTSVGAKASSIVVKRRGKIAARTVEEEVQELRARGLGYGKEEQRVFHALIADLIARLIREGDHQGMADLAEHFGKDIFPHLESVGSELMSSLDSRDWRKAVAFVSMLESEGGRRLVSGMVGEAICINPALGDELYRSDEIAGVKGKGPGKFSFSVWSQAGKGLFGHLEPDVLQDIKTLLRGRPQENEGFVSGLGDGLVDALGSNDRNSTMLFMENFPSSDSKQIVSSILQKNLRCDEGNMSSFQALLSGMCSAGGYPADDFKALGSKIRSETYVKFFLSDPSLTDSSELKSVLGGWVSKHPKSAVEIVCATGSPDLVRPAFSAWMDRYSMEASKWLGSQQPGELRDACVEELCIHLAEKGSKEQATAWLDQLPQSSRESLKSRFGL